MYNSDVIPNLMHLDNESASTDFSMSTQLFNRYFSTQHFLVACSQMTPSKISPQGAH